MILKKILKFLKMNKYEKHRSWIRNTFRFFNKKYFGSVGKKSYFLDPQFLSGTKYIYMADDVGIWNDARVEVLDEWEGKKFNPEVIIGNHVNIGQNLHLTCANQILIEDNVLISARVSILGINHLMEDKNVSILQQGINAEPITIREGAFIGINSVIMAGVTIGRHAIIGANSVVTKDVPDYVTVVGSPIREIRKNYE